MHDFLHHCGKEARLPVMGTFQSLTAEETRYFYGMALAKEHLAAVLRELDEQRDFFRYLFDESSLPPCR